jgi:hypothetical protein
MSFEHSNRIATKSENENESDRESEGSEADAVQAWGERPESTNPLMIYHAFHLSSSFSNTSLVPERTKEYINIYPNGPADMAVPYFVNQGYGADCKQIDCGKEWKHGHCPVTYMQIPYLSGKLISDRTDLESRIWLRWVYHRVNWTIIRDMPFNFMIW